MRMFPISSRCSRLRPDDVGQNITVEVTLNMKTKKSLEIVLSRKKDTCGFGKVSRGRTVFIHISDWICFSGYPNKNWVVHPTLGRLVYGACTPTNHVPHWFSHKLYKASINNTNKNQRWRRLQRRFKIFNTVSGFAEAVSSLWHRAEGKHTCDLREVFNPIMTIYELANNVHVFIDSTVEDGLHWFRPSPASSYSKATCVHLPDLTSVVHLHASAERTQIDEVLIFEAPRTYSKVFIYSSFS